METTIYKQRIELNNWEILGIEKYLKEVFNLPDDFIYTNKAIYFDANDNTFSAYKVNNGDDLYITNFIDDGDNKTYRIDVLNSTFMQLDDSYNFIDEVENIFE